MAESFLLEQLNRMRAMSERMSEVRTTVLENSELIARDRELSKSNNPLAGVRDLRLHHTDTDADDAREPESLTGRRAVRRRR